MSKVDRRHFLKGTFGGLAGAMPLVSLASTPRLPSTRERIADFKGRIIERDNPAYENWRRGMVWQMRKPDRFPDLILRPTDEKDVAAAMKFAGNNGMRVGVRSGGHHIWAASVRDNGMLLDMSLFKQTYVQTGSGFARIGPSIWARDIMAALEEHDCAFPVAHCASLPLGGYILGGGLGLNGDEWDEMACFAILGGTMVTADGERVEVSEKHNSDLLWAMRGGGGALPGVVTEMTVKVFDRPARVFSGTYVFPLADLDSALDLLQTVADMKARNTEMLCLMTHNPQAPADAPMDIQKVLAVRAQVYADDLAQAAPVLDAIAAFPAAGRSVFSMPREPESYEKLFADSMDWRRGFGFGRFAVENAWTNTMRDSVMNIAGEFIQTPSWKSHVVIQPKNIHIDAHRDSAFSVMGNTYIGIYCCWDDVQDDRQNLEWLDRITARLDEHAVGHYVNEIDAASNPQRLERCYSSEAWNRLREIRKTWDPGNTLHDFPGLS